MLNKTYKCTCWLHLALLRDPKLVTEKHFNMFNDSAVSHNSVLKNL